jgi:hypothetical protein
MRRDQSEDYSRPEDVLVYRDLGYGYHITRAIDEPARVGTEPITVSLMLGVVRMKAEAALSWHEPSDEMVELAAEMLLAQAGESTIVTVEDLREQIAENRGIRFARLAVGRVAARTLEASKRVPGAYWLSKRSLGHLS